MSTWPFGARRMPQYAAALECDSTASGTDEAQRELALGHVVGSGRRRQHTGEHPVELAGSDQTVAPCGN